MDKGTLSHYGWIVVMVLTLSVLLALGTPFGRYIGRGISVIANSILLSLVMFFAAFRKGTETSNSFPTAEALSSDIEVA